MINRKDSNVQPGFCIVQTPGTLAWQAQSIFQGKNSEAKEFFMALNKDTPWVKPGQMLIIADKNNKNQIVQLKNLQESKKRVNMALATADSSTATFIHKHYETIAALTSWGDTTTGLVADAGEKYYSRIESILKKIETTYQNQFRTQGTLISQQFFAERQTLFAELKPLLNSVTRLSLKLKKYDNLKTTLGLSSRSIIHEWEAAGVGAIKGYANHIENAAKAAKFMKAGGWIAIGFSFTNTTNDVFKACTSGREHECSKAAVKNYSKFSVSTVGGIAGGYGATVAAAPACLAIGAATAGVGGLVCGIVAATAGGMAGGYIGDKAGGTMGDGINYLLYKGE